MPHLVRRAKVPRLPARAGQIPPSAHHHAGRPAPSWGANPAGEVATAPRDRNTLVSSPAANGMEPGTGRWGQPSFARKGNAHHWWGEPVLWTGLRESTAQQARAVPRDPTPCAALGGRCGRGHGWHILSSSSSVA